MKTNRSAVMSLDEATYMASSFLSQAIDNAHIESGLDDLGIDKNDWVGDNAIQLCDMSPWGNLYDELVSNLFWGEKAQENATKLRINDRLLQCAKDYKDSLE